MIGLLAMRSLTAHPIRTAVSITFPFFLISSAM